ncbi:TonB-dependent receptor domain-containing protein [Roseivirga sp. E12]|uniref:TonB-dependent receptor n=1 Tax=Roseivirga sp. E12 TaxID=2819237 RepID=UPI001ABCCF38|nr:TonB-dependent receptor [Roseivirga sp. E12]MBO3699960.1 TonB-dependent receptor [Roseivirga sp. E12]
MIRGYLLSFLVFVLITDFAVAQTGCAYDIKGKVISAEDGKAISFATIEVVTENNRQALASKSDGTFEMLGICQKEVSILVRFIGFQDFEQKYVLNSGLNTIEIRLLVDVKNLGEVTIEDEKVAEIVTIQRSEINAEALNRSAGASLGEALTEITGVNMLQTGPTIAKPVIHGLHSNRILILNNGIRQEGQQWGQEHAPEIDPFVANNLRLIKGAAAVKYGSDAIGGVILVNPAELPNSPSFSGKVNLLGASNSRLYASSALFEGGINGLDGFGWRVQGTFKKGGDAQAADYRLTNTGTEEQNFSLGFGYHKDNLGLEVFYSSFNAELGVLRSAHIGNLTDLAIAIDSDRPLFIEDFSYDINNPFQDVKHQLLKANGHIELKDLGDFSIQYGLQNNVRKEFDIRRAGRSTIPALSLDLVTHTLDVDLDMSAKGNWKWDVGASFLFQVNQNDPETGIRPLIPDFENWTAGAHLIGRFIKTKYELEFGVRYDHRHYLVKRFDQNNVLQKPEFDFDNVTGSVGAVFFLSDDWTFRSNLGTAWRAPHVNELYSEGLHHGAAAIEEGNADLKSERSLKWINSLEKYTDRFSVSVSAYYNLITDYIYLRPESVELTIRGAFPVFRYQQTDALIYGVDTDLEYRFSDQLEATAKLSLIRAKDRDLNSPLINIPSSQLEGALVYNFIEGRLAKPFVSAGFRAVSRQGNAPRVVSISEVLDANNNDLDLFANDPSIFDFVAPPEGYVNFNLSGGFDLKFRNENSLNVFMSVDNLFNNSYRDYLNRFRYYADDLGRNVSIKLSYTF